MVLSIRIRLFAAALAAPLLYLPAPAEAASSFDGCTGMIASLPTTISTQGVWCFDKDLSVAITTGYAITIGTNNVTIDCNGFKLGGLAGGAGTNTLGIFGDSRNNVGVRDCNIRGFAVGVSIQGQGTGGHRVERNRLDGNRFAGIVVVGDGSLVRDNAVFDTGGSTSALPAQRSAAIVALGQVDVLDNQIVGVDGAGASENGADGIVFFGGSGAQLAGNRISGVVPDPDFPGETTGIRFVADGLFDVRDNVVFVAAGVGVRCASAKQMLRENHIVALLPQSACGDGGDNYGGAAVFP